MTKTAIHQEWEKELDVQRKEIEDARNEPRYLLSVYQTGDVTMTMGDPERQELPRRYYVPNASLQDIKDTIEDMGTPKWSHPMLKFTSTEEEKEAIPYDEKRWSVVYDFTIEPMTKELEDAYVEGAMDGFFKKYRRLYGTSKEMLPHDVAEKNFEEGFEEDSFVIDYSESGKKKYGINSDS